MVGISDNSHMVVVDESVTPNALRFSPVFNVAVPFIDRHVSEGRGNRVALRHPGGDVTYAELADNVGRAGNALLEPGPRSRRTPGDGGARRADVLLRVLGRREGRHHPDRGEHVPQDGGLPFSRHGRRVRRLRLFIRRSPPKPPA